MILGIHRKYALTRVVEEQKHVLLVLRHLWRTVVVELLGRMLCVSGRKPRGQGKFCSRTRPQHMRKPTHAEGYRWLSEQQFGGSPHHTRKFARTPASQAVRQNMREQLVGCIRSGEAFTLTPSPSFSLPPA